MSDILAEIIERKREHVRRCKIEHPLDELEAALADIDPPRGFLTALSARRAQGRFGLIAEIKKASPSGGLIRPDFDPAAIANAYQDAGAACLSVLTDEPYFQGKPAYLIAARQACDLPILRKDFMIDPYQIVEARSMGADCILLIMAVLDDAQARELEATAITFGLDVLVEVHDRDELDRALKLRSPLIGINNRNLKTLVTSIETSVDLTRDIEPERLIVSESGLKTHQDLQRMSEAGITTFLVGESLLRQDDLRAATRQLLTGQA